MREISLAVSSLLIALGRFTVPGHELSWAGTYEAFAHIWVGILLTLGFYGCRFTSFREFFKSIWWQPLVYLFVVTNLETIMFLLRSR
jgi:hypothetical protein